MRKYKKPIFLVETFATNEYVASCGTEITKIPEQTVHCIATCDTTVFGSGTCTNVASIVTTSYNGNSEGTIYYNDVKSAATDIYDGKLGNDGIYCSTQRGNVPIPLGTEYVVWKADAQGARGAKHANVYSTVKETIQKS